MHIDSQAYYSPVRLGGSECPPKPRLETPIERIYYEVTGRKMPPSVKRILLSKPTAKDGADFGYGTEKCQTTNGLKNLQMAGE